MKSELRREMCNFRSIPMKLRIFHFNSISLQSQKESALYKKLTIQQWISIPYQISSLNLGKLILK